MSPGHPLASGGAREQPDHAEVSSGALAPWGAQGPTGSFRAVSEQFSSSFRAVLQAVFAAVFAETWAAKGLGPDTGDFQNGFENECQNAGAVLFQFFAVSQAVFFAVVQGLF